MPLSKVNQATLDIELARFLLCERSSRSAEYARAHQKPFHATMKEDVAARSNLHTFSPFMDGSRGESHSRRVMTAPIFCIISASRLRHEQSPTQLVRPFADPVPSPPIFLVLPLDACLDGNSIASLLN